MDYQKAYTTLFNAMTHCIRILQTAQQETEEMFMAEQDEDEGA